LRIGLIFTLSSQGDPLSLKEYLLECQKKVFKEVRIITERKRGSDEYRPFFSEEKSLWNPSNCSPDAGSWGATIACLKKERILKR